MTLVDAGPLVALCDSNEEQHEACLRALRRVRLPMQTTLAALTEAFHILGERGGWHAQRMLWSLIARNDLQVANLDALAIGRCTELMDQYSDLPMDFADATLVAIAETLRSPVIFTLDRHFTVYRTRSGRSIKTVP